MQRIQIRRTLTGIVLIAISATISATVAQAQVVQLPVVRQFGVTTTVMVPDGGAAHMGGVRRAAEGQVSRGNPLLPGRLGSNRAIGREFSTSDAYAVVRIIDFKELDRMTLSAASPDEIALLSDKAAGITDTIRKNRLNDAGASSLAELRSKRASVDAEKLAAIRQQLSKAQAFEQDGRLSSAKLYYRLAYRDGDAAIRTLAYAGLHRIAKASRPKATPESATASTDTASSNVARTAK